MGSLNDTTDILCKSIHMGDGVCVDQSILKERQREKGRKSKKEKEGKKGKKRTGIFLGITMQALDPPRTAIDVRPSDRAAFMAYSVKGKQ